MLFEVRGGEAPLIASPAVAGASARGLPMIIEPNAAPLLDMSIRPTVCDKGLSADQCMHRRAGSPFFSPCRLKDLTVLAVCCAPDLMPVFGPLAEEVDCVKPCLAALPRRKEWEQQQRLLLLLHFPRRA